MFNDNYFFIKVDNKEEISNYQKANYIQKLSAYYWEITHNTYFLYKYRDALKETMKAYNFLYNKYLRGKNYERFSLESSNCLIICQKVKK